MKVRLAVIAVLLASPGLGQASKPAPFKLILREGQGMVAIDYPSLSRCRAALEWIEAENERRRREAQAETDAMRGPNGQQGGYIIPSIMLGFCLPG